MSSYSEMNNTSTSSQVSYAAAAASGASDGGLYVPLHRRNSIDSQASSVGPMRGGKHSRSSSIASSSPPAQSTSLPSTLSPSSSSTPSLPVYNISQLLHLSHSPLATISPDARVHIRNTVPEISLNRKQRKARELREREGPEAAQTRHRRSASASTADSGRSTPTTDEVAAAPRAPLNATHRVNSAKHDARSTLDRDQADVKKQKRESATPGTKPTGSTPNINTRARALPSGTAASRRTHPFGSVKGKRGLIEEGSWRKASQDAAKVFSIERQRSGQPVVLAI